MDQRETRLEDFLEEVGYGEIRIIVVNKKLHQIPKQRIERPGKNGIQFDIVIAEPIRLRASEKS